MPSRPSPPEAQPTAILFDENNVVIHANSLVFPPNFMWGTATASHQVEGGNANNDWWDWESSPGHIRDGTVSGRACDHYRLFREDFDLLADLHQNSHRLSLEWSR